MGWWFWPIFRWKRPQKDLQSGPLDPPGYWESRLHNFRREERERPDYWNTPEAFLESRNDGYFRPATTEEDVVRASDLAGRVGKSGMVQFLLRSEDVGARENAEARLRNDRPTRKEDAALWKDLPPVPGPYNGLPMPRLSISSVGQAQTRFWDFFKEFQFGLWGYKQRPYPEGRPIDVQQVLGYKWLDKRYYDFAMRSFDWYYKDRLGRSRGPMQLIQLKTAWAGGIIDKNTFIWGDDMDEWAPIGMVYGLEAAIVTPDVKLAAAGTDFIHRIARGISMWIPRKGHEKKSYKQLQREAIDNRERQKAVLRLNGGVWPGERAPSHSLFLWASGTELTPLIENSGSVLPDKFIPYEIRKKLAQEIPGLRALDVLNYERLMEIVTFSGEWYREDLGAFCMKADYESDWNEDFKIEFDAIRDDLDQLATKVGKIMGKKSSKKQLEGKP